MGGAWDRFTDIKPKRGHMNFDVRYPNLMRRLDNTAIIFFVVMAVLSIAATWIN